MRSPRSREFRLLVTVVSIAAVAVALVLAGPLSGAADSRTAAEAWQSAFERRAALPAGGRMIVVLAGPSLAERVARQGQLSPRAQRRFVKRAQAFQRRLLSALRVQGVKIKPLFAYTRTFNGFSAVLDAARYRRPRKGARGRRHLPGSHGVSGIGLRGRARKLGCRRRLA